MNPSVYKYGGIALGVVAILAAAIAATVAAYNSVYDSGFAAGETAIRAGYQERLLQAQDRALEMQKEIYEKSVQFTALQQQYVELEAKSPEEVIRYVRSDPKFAATRRPADLHALRVRELQSLRQTAAAR